MGLLDEYGIDLDEVEVASYDVPDDIYPFEVSAVYIQNGTDNYPDRKWIIVEYLLGDAGKKKSEWFQLPEDPSAPTDAELEKLGYYKSRLIDLGIPPEATGNVGPDDLIGKTGTLQVFSQKGKGANADKTFQNIKNVRLDDEGGNDFANQETAEAAPAAAAPARKAATTQKAATQKAAQAGVKKNPFA